MKPIISRLRHTVVALLFALSISAANAQISYTATFDQHLLTTRYTLPVYPTQPPIPSDRNTSEQLFVSPDSTVYSNNRYWPAVPVQVVDEGFLDGDNHIVTVAVCPISYAPTDGEILFRNSVTVRLDYSGDIPQSNRQK